MEYHIYFGAIFSHHLLNDNLEVKNLYRINQQTPSSYEFEESKNIVCFVRDFLFTLSITDFVSFYCYFLMLLILINIFQITEISQSIQNLIKTDYLSFSYIFLSITAQNLSDLAVYYVPST